MLWVQNESETRQLGNGLLETFHHLADNREFQQCKPRSICSGPCEICNETRLNRIRDPDENNWNRLRHLLEHRNGAAAANQNEVRPLVHKCFSIAPYAGDIVGRPTHLDPNVLALSPAQLKKSFSKCGQSGLNFGVA